MAYGARIKLRLFIEGVEVPVIAAQVQAVANSPMVASIQVPPLGEGLKLPPRCCVHLFFYDFNSAVATDQIRKTGTSDPERAGPTVYEQVVNYAQESDERDPDVILNNYKVLFAGEIMGFNWSKNPTQRSLILQCSDFSNYWDYAYQFNNTDIFGPGYKAMFSGGSTNLFTDFLTEPGSVVVRIIKTPPTRYPNMKGLGGGLIHLVESIGGSYWYEKRYAGQNVFFSLAELRLRITQMLTAYENDPTSSKLLGGQYDGMFGRSIGNLGEQASIRKCITALSAVIFHEMYPQPCPYYRPGSHGSVSGGFRKNVKELRVYGALAAEALGLRDSLKDVIERLSQVTLPSVDAPTERRLAVRAAAKEASNTLSVVRKGCSILSRKVRAEVSEARRLKVAGVAAMAGTFDARLQEAQSIIGKVITRLRNPKGAELEASSTQLLTAWERLNDILSLEADASRTDTQVPAIFGQQIFRPDVWFSAPPRCNVIFPEQYNSLQVTRMFMNEPTRLLLKTNDEFFGEDELFDKFYFAPKAITLKGESNQLRSILRNDILDHELYTGILPVFEKMGEFNIFAARSGMADGKTPKLGLAQRSCNFLYFKHRFSSRQLMVQGRFNPYIAVGFPGLVLDQYVDIESINDYNKLIHSLPEEYRSAVRGVDKLLGTHFLASFSQVTHNVEASGQGVTAIGCSYARQPDESVEFLGVEQGEVTGMEKKKGFVERETEVAAVVSPRINSTGPAWGRIIKVEEVTDKYTTTDFNNGPRLPVYAGTGGLDLSDQDKKKDQRKGETIVEVPIGITSKASDYGDKIVTLVGDPDIFVAFKAYRITEEVNRARQEKKIDLPPEEYIRPGWYGDCWHPAKISDVYYDMLNTGAITEPQQIQSIESVGERLISSDAAAEISDALANSDYQNIGSDNAVTLSLAKGASIENAVAHLAYTYSLIKQGGYDVDAFINSYTWRPVATLLDMFGSHDLRFSSDGSRVVQGVEGFHSRAFGPYADLFGLVTQDIEEVVGIKRGSTQSQKADKRQAKLDAVLRYTARLRLSRGILG